MSPISDPPVPPPFRDRSAGLVVFGVLTVLIGIFCALIVPLILFGNAEPPGSGAPVDRGPILVAAAAYGAVAVVLIWLGVGSIRALRWARALLLILSWTWLLMGLVALGFILLVLPQISAAIPSSGPSGPLSDNAKLAIVLVPILVIFVLMVLLPGIWVLFYRSIHVRATCERRDPVTRWTDRCPLPVLAISLWLAVGALSLISAPLGSVPVVPFFGMFLHGAAGALALLVVAAAWLYAARACYHLRFAGWGIAMGTLVVFAVSHFLTYSLHDVNEVYQLMGYTPEQMAEIQKFRFLTGRSLAWMALLWTLPGVAYLLYAKRFFPKPIRL